MEEVKQISVKNGTHYFYNDMINLKDLESNLLILKSCTKTLLFTTLDTLRWKILMIKFVVFAI